MSAGKVYQCPECGERLQSTYRHHMVMCACPNRASVDGGSEYARLGWKNQKPVPVTDAKPERR